MGDLRDVPDRGQTRCGNLNIRLARVDHPGNLRPPAQGTCKPQIAVQRSAVKARVRIDEVAQGHVDIRRQGRCQGDRPRHAQLSAIDGLTGHIELRPVTPKLNIRVDPPQRHPQVRRGEGRAAGGNAPADRRQRRRSVDLQIEPRLPLQITRGEEGTREPKRRIARDIEVQRPVGIHQPCHSRLRACGAIGTGVDAPGLPLAPGRACDAERAVYLFHQGADVRHVQLEIDRRIGAGDQAFDRRPCAIGAAGAGIEDHAVFGLTRHAVGRERA